MFSALVSSLGLSAVDVMGSIWRVPSIAMYGGHMEIRAISGSDLQQYTPFPREEVTRIVRSIFPEGELTYSLDVPSRPLSANLIMGNVRAVTGREGGFETWYLKPLWRSGEQISRANEGRELFFVKDDASEVRPYTDAEELVIAQYDNTTSTWSFTNAKAIHPKIAGTLKVPMNWAYTHLSTLQRLAQVPTNLITSIGIGLPTVNARIDETKLSELREALRSEFPQLGVMTVDEFAAEASIDLVPLQEAAKRYLPIVLGIAMMVVVATAMAVVQSRRRELSMLRVIGMSARQVWMLFLAEATLAAMMACAVGLLLSKTLSYLVFGARMGFSLITLIKTDVSLLPFALSLVITVVVVAVVSASAVARAMSRVLRNA